MATTGDRFEMPDGSVYVVARASADTGGAEVQMEFVLPVGCVPPPPHVHRDGVEEYEVLEGRFDVMVDGTWTTLGPGEFASVPVGALHTFRNRSGATVRVRNWHRPAMGFDVFIETMYATLRDAGITRPRDPRIPMYLSKVFLDFPGTLQPGRRREAIPMRILAGIAKMLP
ncbi:MAG: cupin domain-containing protein [Solirubrobacteraceae bacterium]|nr:cupin domain-containing protein [Solirubrobacteraceae bacterium]